MESFKYELSCKKTQEKFESVKIKNNEDAVKYARQFWSDDILIYESAFIMLLDKANCVKGWAKISQGGVCGTVIDVKIICKYVIDTLSSSCIIVHNHPSGNLRPSTQDIDFSKRTSQALEIIDAKLLDSLIITDTDYKSIDYGN